MGQATVVARGRPAAVERRSSQQGRLESGHQPRHVKRGVDRRAIEQNELHVGGGASQVEHVGGARGIVAGKRAHRRGQRRIPHPRGQVERLDLQFRYGPWPPGLVPGDARDRQPVGPDLHRVEAQRPPGELKVDAHRRAGGEGDLDRDRLVAGMAPPAR